MQEKTKRISVSIRFSLSFLLLFYDFYRISTNSDLNELTECTNKKSQQVVDEKVEKSVDDEVFQEN